jgi:hypothetical protein
MVRPWPLWSSWFLVPSEYQSCLYNSLSNEAPLLQFVIHQSLSRLILVAKDTIYLTLNKTFISPMTLDHTERTTLAVIDAIEHRSCNSWFKLNTISIGLDTALYMFQTMWSRYCDVVLEGRTIDLGKLWGVGNWNGEGEVSLQATWDQGGWGSHRAKRRDSK